MCSYERSGVGEGGFLLSQACLPCKGISFVFKHHPQTLIASLGQLTAPRPMDVLTFWGGQAKLNLVCLCETNFDLETRNLNCVVNMTNNQPVPDIVPVSVWMCGATFSRLIALDTAAQKQNGHVIRGPLTERQGGFKWRWAEGTAPVYLLNNSHPRLITNRAWNSSSFTQASQKAWLWRGES